MGMPQPQFGFDVRSFLSWEAQQSERHEFVDGEAYAMAGAGDAHNRIAGNLYVALRSALKGTPCRTYLSDMKLHIDSADAYFYPDVFVTCDERDRAPEADLMKRYPRLIVEVLSDKTAAYDRGRKFELYRAIDTLSEVLFINADRRQVDQFRRSPGDAGVWTLHPRSGVEALPLASLDAELTLDLVYDEVLSAG